MTLDEREIDDLAMIMMVMLKKMKKMVSIMTTAMV
jgi:hypothetical protein